MYKNQMTLNGIWRLYIAENKVCKNFANARTVRNILDSLIEIQAVRTMDSDAENERIIKIEDAEQYAKEL